MNFKKLTEEEEAELEALIEAAKQRPMTFEELKRGYLLQGYDETWADFLARNGDIEE